MTDRDPIGMMNWFRNQTTGDVEGKLQTVRFPREEGQFANLSPPGPEWSIMALVPTAFFDTNGGIVLILWGRQRTVGDMLDEKKTSEP